MAMTKALAIPELLDLVLRHAIAIRRKNYSSAMIMRPNQTLVACLYVNKLWFNLAKEILWAHIPDVYVLAQLDESRVQFYADSVQSLFVRISDWVEFNKARTLLEPIAQAYTRVLRKLQFPKLKSLHVSVAHNSSGWWDYFASLPVTCTSIDICLPSSRSTSSFIDEPYFFFTKKMQRILQRLHKCLNLRYLSMFGIPASTVVDFWEYVSDRRGLRAVSASFPGMLEGVANNAYIRSSPLDPSFYADLEAVMDLSHLHHLLVDPCPPKVVPLLLRGTRNLKTIRVNIDWRGHQPHFERPDAYLRFILGNSMENRHLHSLEINRHFELDAQEHDHLIFDSKTLIDLSVHCRHLTQLILGGGRSCTFTIQDSTLDLISRNLPSMRTFLLQGEAPSLTIECLRILAENWPFLADLELRHKFEYTALPLTGPPLWPGLSRTLCNSHDRLHCDHDPSADEPKDLPEWLPAVQYNFPALEQVVTYVPRRVENVLYQAQYGKTTVADQYEVWGLPLRPESKPVLKLVREPGGWGFCATGRRRRLV